MEEIKWTKVWQVENHNECGNIEHKKSLNERKSLKEVVQEVKLLKFAIVTVIKSKAAKKCVRESLQV